MNQSNNAAILAQQVADLTAENARLNVAIEHVDAGLRAAEEDRDDLRADADRYRWLQANYSGPPERLNAAIEALSADMKNTPPC